MSNPDFNVMIIQRQITIHTMADQ